MLIVKHVHMTYEVKVKKPQPLKKPLRVTNASHIFDNSLVDGPEIQQRVLKARAQRALTLLEQRHQIKFMPDRLYGSEEVGYEAMMIGALFDSGISLSVTQLSQTELHARAARVPFLPCWDYESESWVY